MFSRVRQFLRATEQPESGVLLQGAAALICIGFVLWLAFSWTNYDEKYAQATQGWRLGGKHLVELTVVREDRTNLACASDALVGDVRCAFGESEQPPAQAGGDAQHLGGAAARPRRRGAQRELHSPSGGRSSRR